jgi:anthranilate phosphoribosyltransferase
VASLEEGVEVAARTIDSGDAAQTLSRLRERRTARAQAAPVA